MLVLVAGRLVYDDRTRNESLAMVPVSPVNRFAPAARLLRHPAALPVLVLGAACLLSWLSRQDKNWDLQNYHLYAPWALLGNRLGVDLFPAGIQSTLNPLLDVPYYLLATSLLPDSPRLVAAIAGLPVGLLALAVIAILRDVGRHCGADSKLVVAACAALGLSGSTVVAEIGTSFGDVPVAALMLAALLALLRGAARPGWGRYAVVAGALAGAAAGFKLTQIVFAPALAVALLAAGGGWRRALRGLALLGLGWLAAFLLVEGWWGLRVFARFGNPVFPYLNDLFRSDWAAPLSLQDSHYLPASAWRAVLLPFTLLGGRSFVVSEIAFRDPRLALVWLGTLAAMAAGWRPRARARLAPVPRMALAWLAASYLLWEWKFSIVRYAIGIEAMAGLPVLVALRLWLPGLCGRRLGLCLLALLAAGVAATNYPNWGRMKAYPATVFDIAPIAVGDGATVVFAGKPLAFLAPFMAGRAVSFIGLSEAEPDTGLGRELARRIAGAPVLAVVVNRPPAELAAWLAAFGLAIRPASCRPLANPYQDGIALCDGAPARQEGDSGRAAPGDGSFRFGRKLVAIMHGGA